MRGDLAEARACFQRAGALLESPGERELEQAKLLRTERRDGEAAGKLRLVPALQPDNPLAHAMLADILGEAGAFDEARLHSRRAAELDPERVSALFNMTMLQPVGPDRIDLVERMEAMLETPRPEWERSSLHFALGKAHDDRGEPSRAIAHFDAGNEIEHRRHPFDRAAFAAAIDRLIADLGGRCQPRKTECDRTRADKRGVTHDRNSPK